VSPDQLQSFLALVLGFAFAGLCATGYQYMTQRPASFRLLQHRRQLSAFAAVPFLAFAAPFIIMRNTLRARRVRRRRFEFVMLSTILAGFWSLMSGTVMMMALQAVGFLSA
jgi:O-antigen/teichoic acid export membrane protein